MAETRLQSNLKIAGDFFLACLSSLADLLLSALRTVLYITPNRGARRPLENLMLKRLTGVLVVLMFCSNLQAETWDEPWHRDVVAKAETFGLYEVVTASPGRVVLKEVRHLAGAATGPNVEVNGFYDSEIQSVSSVNGVRISESGLRFEGAGSRYYLFLKKASGGTWRIASPTTGFAAVRPDGKVVATFRISIHQALVDSTTYELTQTCIFRKLHGEDCSPDISKYILTQLSTEPAVMSANAAPEQVDRFFTQHAALETAYMIGYAVDRDILSKYLRDSVFHTQISAVRALRASDSKERNAMLMAFVIDDSRNLLARVFAVLMIREVGATELKDQVRAYIPNAPATKVGLGMNIMDPRVGTKFPETLKEALQKLVDEWK